MDETLVHWDSFTANDLGSFESSFYIKLFLFLGLLPNTFNIPHSLTLDEKRRMLYVADRENGRIQCFDGDGKFHREIKSPEFGGLVFAVDFDEQSKLSLLTRAIFA